MIFSALDVDIVFNMKNILRTGVTNGVTNTLTHTYKETHTQSHICSHKGKFAENFKIF